MVKGPTETIKTPTFCIHIRWQENHRTMLQGNSRSGMWLRFSTMYRPDSRKPKSSRSLLTMKDNHLHSNHVMAVLYLKFTLWSTIHPSASILYLSKLIDNVLKDRSSRYTVKLYRQINCANCVLSKYFEKDLANFNIKKSMCVSTMLHRVSYHLFCICGVLVL